MAAVIDVGVIGTGVIATNTHIPVLRAMPGVRIAWVGDSNTALAGNVAQLHRTHAVDLSRLEGVPRVDAVLLAIPIPPRARYLEYLRSTGTAVLVEKPLANSVGDHRALMEGFEGWQLGVGYQRRFYASFRLMKAAVVKGMFGPLRGIQVREGGRTTRTGGAGEYLMAPTKLGGGIVKNLGCHSIDLAIWLSGATGHDIHDLDLERDGDTDLACSTRATLTTPDGDVDFDWGLSWLNVMENTFTLCFETVRMRCGMGPDGHVEILSASGDRLGQLTAEDGARTSAQAFFMEWRDFLAAAAELREQPVSARDTLHTAAFMATLLGETGDAA